MNMGAMVWRAYHVRGTIRQVFALADDAVFAASAGRGSAVDNLYKFIGA